MFKQNFRVKILSINKEDKKLENYLADTKEIISFDGKVLKIDLEQAGYLLKSSAKLILENKELLLALKDAKSLKGLGLLYRSVAVTFENTKTSLAKNLRSTASSVTKDGVLIESLIKGQKVFNVTGAIWVTISLYVITNFLLSNKPIVMILGLGTSSSDNVSQNIIPPLRGFVKKITNKISYRNKSKLLNWVKIIVVVVYIIWLVYFLWKKLNVFMIVKIVGLIFLSLLALLYFLYVLILIKNFNINHKDVSIILPWY